MTTKRRLNISIDDVTPHALSSYDAVKPACDLILTRFPSAKFTLFIPTAYHRTMYIERRVDTRTALPLKLSQHEEFCRQLASLSSDNFEFAYHGHYHGIPDRSNNDEFRYLSYDEAVSQLQLMFAEVNKTCIASRFVPVFRPPAMRMSHEAFQACADVGIKCLALTDRDMYVSEYGGHDSLFRHIVNANVWPPTQSLDAVGQSYKIEALYHACTWDQGFLSIERANELCDWIAVNDVEHVFIQEL